MLVRGAGARGDRELRELEQALGLTPGADRAGGVGAHDQRQRCVGIAGMYGSQGIHGIGQAATLKLDVAHAESLDVVDCQPTHAQPVLGARILRS